MITYKQIREYSPEVATLVTKLCQEIKYDYQEASIRVSLKALFESDAFICVGAYYADKLVGVMSVLEVPELYNHNIITASEQFWYVEPKHRKGVGITLVKFIEKIIVSDKISFGISTPRLQKLLERHGYKQLKSIVEKYV